MSADYMEALRAQLALATHVGHWDDFDPLERRNLTLAIERAIPTFVAPQIVAVCEESCWGIPTDVVLTEDLLPAADGFAFFARRIVPREGLWTDPSLEGDRFQLGALLWSVGLLSDVYPEPPRDGTLGVRLLACLPAVDEQIWDAHAQVLSWQFHSAWNEPYHCDAEDPVYRFVRRTAYALWAFMRERRVSTVTARGVDRALRKQADRAGWTHEPIVQIVELRAAEPRSRSYEGDASPVDWSCRWAVRGHWHRYWYGEKDKPDERALRAKWVPAFVKGPADKPLRSATKLLAVVR